MSNKNKRSVIRIILDLMGKYYFATATLVFVVCVAAVFLILPHIANAKDEKMRREKELAETETVSEDGRNYALEKDAYPEINETIANYYKAVAEDDEETVQKYLLYTNQTELDLIAVKSEYTDSYNDIICYTQKAAAEGAYYVYVSYNLKLKDFDTQMPGLIGFYYCPDENGNPKICKQGDISEEVLKDFYIAYNMQAVQDLYNRVALEYNEALDGDEELKKYMDNFDEMIRQDITKRIALREATEIPSEPESQSEEVVETNVTETVEPTTTVNVRGSASEKGEVKGQVGPGTQLTRVEAMINGWSHVIYNGADGYIRSDYLTVVGSNEVPAGANTVTVKEGVNIRAKDSTDSDVVAMAEPGTKLELIEKQSNGWSKIKYNGQTAYVKSDYVE